MPRCASCDEPIRGDVERVGARCPRCRQPLYEDPPHSQGAAWGPADSSRCATHAQSAAVGTCQRCGNFMCAVCRTRWRNQALCVGCVERALEAKEATPAEARAHLRQAILAILFGVVAWFLALVAIGITVAAMTGNEPNVAVGSVGVLLLLATPLPALLGVGQGAAAIRARGNHMILATIGLILSGLHTGLLVGLLTFALWQNR